VARREQNIECVTITILIDDCRLLDSIKLTHYVLSSHGHRVEHDILITLPMNAQERKENMN